MTTSRFPSNNEKSRVAGRQLMRPVFKIMSVTSFVVVCITLAGRERSSEEGHVAQTLAIYAIPRW